MWVAVVNNLPEMILGSAWTGLCVFSGYAFGRWRFRRV